MSGAVIELTGEKLQAYLPEISEALERVNKAGLDVNEELNTLDKRIDDTKEMMRNREETLNESLDELKLLQDTLAKLKMKAKPQ